MRNSSVPRIAVIGCGYWGRNLVRNFHELGALHVVADTSIAGRELASQLVPGIEVSGNLEQLITRPDIDAFAIATPAVTHCELGRKILDQGKDLFVEKPLALTLDDARRLVDL